jgi:hypothetical protein
MVILATALLMESSSGIGAGANEKANYSFINISTEASATDDQKQEIKGKVNEIIEKHGEVRLVIGESLAAPHAIKRFASPKWIFLDPNVESCEMTHIGISLSMENNMKRNSRTGIKGYIKDLARLPELAGMVSYIVDDPEVLGGIPKYNDVRVNGEAFDNLSVLHGVLKEGGVLTTSPRVLSQITDEEFKRLKEMYDIRYFRDMPIGFAKPYKDISYGESASSFGSEYENWSLPELPEANEGVLEELRRYYALYSKPASEFDLYKAIVGFIDLRKEELGKKLKGRNLNISTFDGGTTYNLASLEDNETNMRGVKSISEFIMSEIRGAFSNLGGHQQTEFTLDEFESFILAANGFPLKGDFIKKAIARECRKLGIQRVINDSRYRLENSHIKLLLRNDPYYGKSTENQMKLYESIGSELETGLFFIKRSTNTEK